MTDYPLAIGVPGEGVCICEAGLVNIIYGSASGLNATNDQIWYQSSAGIEDTSEANDSLGSSLAAGISTCGFTDLAIRRSWKGVGSMVNAGLVNIIYGSASVLMQRTTRSGIKAVLGIEDHQKRTDSFGSSLAAGISTMMDTQTLR